VFHYPLLPVGLMNIYYAVIAFLVVVAGVATAASYCLLKRQRGRSPESADNANAEGGAGWWGELKGELADSEVAFTLAFTVLFLANVLGAFSGSLMWLLSMPAVLILLPAVKFFLSKSKDGALSRSDKCNYLLSAIILGSVAVPVGVDAYFMNQPTPATTYYQDASGGYHDSIQRNPLVGKVIESRKADGVVEYQWGEQSTQGNNIVMPNTGNTVDALRRVEVVEDLSSGEAPYVVRKIDIGEHVGVSARTTLCPVQDNVNTLFCSRSHDKLDAGKASAVSVIHVPSGERDKYVTSSPAGS
jgi:hypothetical protein